MAEVIGYGEDALTFWALTKRIDFILQELGDGSSSENCLPIYRPSFGRGRGANFGEFDAILATSKSIYLIESKWDCSKEIKNGTVQLKPNQINRHKIFNWYFNNWNKDEFQDWSSFVKRYEKEFQEEFEKNIANTNNDISQKIEFVKVEYDTISNSVGGYFKMNSILEEK